MSRRLTVRQFHRWISVVFLLAVLINTIVVVRGGYNNQLGFLAVVPLFILMASGVVLLIQPYLARWQRR